MQKSYGELVDFLVRCRGYVRSKLITQPWSALLGLACDAAAHKSRPGFCDEDERK